MKLQMVGCHHQRSSVAVREKLAFNTEQAERALISWREAHPGSEAVLLSTCHRIELYAAADGKEGHAGPDALAKHMAHFHGVSVEEVHDQLITLEDGDAVRHLFRVAASLDSMVVGEPQILAQVKQAYELALQIGSTGPVTNQFFQAALRTARRVANETSLHRQRVSIPSVAIADFASSIFEGFDDKRVLVIGAGEMAEETLRYLVDAGARQIVVINRNIERAADLARKWKGHPAPWEKLLDELAAADLVISTTGAAEPIVTLQSFHSQVAPHRKQRPLFVLDLAVPRDFEAAIGNELGTYVYSVDDLEAACQRNRLARQAEMPVAEAIVEREAFDFLVDTRHRVAGPIIAQLREGFAKTEQEELLRLYRKLPDLDESAKKEIQEFADRLVGKLLHPPMVSLRDVAKTDSPHHLLDALKRLFQLKE